MSSNKITDATLISELCGSIKQSVAERTKKIFKEATGNETVPESFACPLDDKILGDGGLLKDLIPTGDHPISYAKADKLDNLWRELLDRSIQCLRYFDKREPFLENPAKPIVAYGIDKLKDYHDRYTKFEGLLYGASDYYRDHVFHAIRVWMLGILCLLKPMEGSDGETVFIDSLGLDGGASFSSKINCLEYISMWTIAALCHDLGYPLEKSEQILDATRKMMKDFVPNPNIWSNFGYSGTQDSINEYILKFISTKMKEVKPEEIIEETLDASGKASGTDPEPEQEAQKEKEYVGRIQPKYYLKYAKSLESFQHGIISTVIIYKMLLYFLESDFNLNDDYRYGEEDARQFYIRREILRAIASHTCSDAYNIHLTTFSSLLFLCDELQEWGRKTWNELYTGLNENSIQLNIDKFSGDTVEITEKIDMQAVEDDEIVVQNICRVFERQYSLYKTTFRDGQYTAKRDFHLKKTIIYTLHLDGTTERKLRVDYALPKSEPSYFRVLLHDAGDKAKINMYQEEIRKAISKELYGQDLQIDDLSVVS